ncbi:hypothetical protein EXIGLDRAFT_420763 [Exidia glandulosa HHB12029]|uniref:Uncharacterized protein n=1 Tax=Exidia glandulosa HHB12029 TaxID=1314781 RepID=A0A165KLR0_EXIGL|nr:hypothetical protein EXIGLDRAFT_420763 [Exidia glandulosa HHB12029]
MRAQHYTALCLRHATIVPQEGLVAEAYTLEHLGQVELHDVRGCGRRTVYSLHPISRVDAPRSPIAPTLTVTSFSSRPNAPRALFCSVWCCLPSSRPGQMLNSRIRSRYRATCTSCGVRILCQLSIGLGIVVLFECASFGSEMPADPGCIERPYTMQRVPLVPALPRVLTHSDGLWRYCWS